MKKDIEKKSEKKNEVIAFQICLSALDFVEGIEKNTDMNYNT